MDQFAIPAEAKGRTIIASELPWDRAHGPVDSAKPLTDENVWLIGFTAGTTPHSGLLSAVELGGSQIARNFQLIRNSDGAVLLENEYPMNAPGFGFVAKRMGRLDHRIVLVPGVRYTFALWNWEEGQSSEMRAELYF